MKRKWRGLTFYFILFVAFSWWDFWYPELTETAGIYEVIYEENTVQMSEEMIECELNEEKYNDRLKSDGDKVHFRFRIWEWIKNI